MNMKRYYEACAENVNRSKIAKEAKALGLTVEGQYSGYIFSIDDPQYPATHWASVPNCWYYDVIGTEQDILAFCEMFGYDPVYIGLSGDNDLRFISL